MFLAGIYCLGINGVLGESLVEGLKVVVVIIWKLDLEVMVGNIEISLRSEYVIGGTGAFGVEIWENL